MKKIILIVSLFVSAGLALTGCSDNSEPFTEKSYTPNTQISEILVDVRDREIEVSLSEDEQVHIQYSENNKGYYDISVSDENVLSVTTADDKEWTDYIGGKPSDADRKISIQIPNTLLDSLTLSTTNENISLSALTVTGNVSISSNGGNVAFDSLDIGDGLYLNVKNGDVSGKVVGGYDDFAIRSNVKKGDSNLPDIKDGGEKTLDVSVNNGDIDIELAKG